MDAADAPQETLEQVQARHRREKKDLQGRITSKKKNATKKTRKGVNDECAALEHALADKHAAELSALAPAEPEEADEEGEGEVAAVDSADSVAEKLADVTIAVAPAPAPSEPKKKRNRQKERLARRAAEQESLALAAEHEASAMTDHRAVERAALADTLRAHGLAEHDVPADGHCLFSAVADQLVARGYAAEIPALQGRGPVGYRLLRAVAAAYIRDHGDVFGPFLEEPVAAYADKMESTAEWGGQVELQALAEACGLEIHVVQKGGEQVIKAAEGEGKRIWVAYYLHGFGLGEHYNSLRGGKE